jgi:pantoate--beta-alanine ligase
MELVRRVHAMKEVCRQARANGRAVGFVPTMGALHEGHLSLIRRVKELADLVVVSIFVNPTQFGPSEDFERYPRDLARDVDLCIGEEVDYVFAPAVEEIFPADSLTWVEVAELSQRLEGASRPTHFRGVATVVMKLLQVVQPSVAALGQKDAQQAAIVRQMVRDLMLDVEVLVLPTARDRDGLALSSRNVYLSPEEREAARAIPRALEAARRAIADGQRAPDKVRAAARAVLEEQKLLRVDYVELVDPARLEPVTQVQGELLLLLSVYAGETRLLDNATLRA